MLLLDEHEVDPQPWLALPHAREQAATVKLRELQERLGHQESGYRYVETKVRGPEQLRKLCGDATLTEVSGAGFWSFADDIPIPTDFGDDDVDVVMTLPGLEWITANYT